jgi:hypothetical protein
VLDLPNKREDALNSQNNDVTLNSQNGEEEDSHLNQIKDHVNKVVPEEVSIYLSIYLSNYLIIYQSINLSINLYH